MGGGPGQPGCAVNGPTDLQGGALHIPAPYVPILLQALGEAVRGGAPSPLLRQVFEAAGRAAREGAAVRIRATVPERRPELLTVRPEPATPSEYTADTAGVVLGVSGRCVRKLLNRGVLTGRRVGPRGQWRVDRASVEAYRRRR